MQLVQERWTSIVTHSQNRLYYTLLFIVIVLELACVWSVAYPPLNDLPLHVANAYIAYAYHAAPEYQSVYMLQLGPTPNSGFFFIMTPLMAVFSPIIATKIFLTVLIVTYIFGCHLLGRALYGHNVWNAVEATFFLFSSPLIWGFVNYLFGTGLFLITSASWIFWRTRWSILRIITVALLSTSCYLTHLSAFAFLIGVTLVWTIYDSKKGESLPKLLTNLFVLLALPLFCFAVFLSSNGTIGTFQYGTLYTKLAGLAGLVTTYDQWSHWFAFVLIVAAAILLFRGSHAVRVNWPALITAILFTVAWLASPITLFTSLNADLRFVLPAVIFIVFSIEIAVPRRTGSLAGAMLVCFGILRIITIGLEWMPISRRIERQLTLFHHMKTGTCVYGLLGGAPDGPATQRSNRALSNVLSYAVIDRKCKVSTHLAIREQSAVAYRTPPYQTWAADRDWRRIFQENDYIWALRANSALLRTLDVICTPIDSVDEVRLYRIRK